MNSCLQRIPPGSSETQRFFGKVAQRDLFLYDIAITKHTTRLTGEEELKMRRYERAGTVGKRDYVNADWGDMIRCPLESCGYSTIN